MPATVLLAPPSPGGLATWLPFLGATVAALIAAAALLYQRRKNENLEKQKLDLERQKLAWEREKTQLTLATEKAAVDDQRLKDEERAAQERLLAEASRGDLAGREAGYRVKLRHELSQLKILDMTRPLDLDKIYVRVRIRERVPPRYVDDADLHTTRSRSDRPGEASVTSDSMTGDSAPVVLPPSEALRRYHRIVVLGDPGAGKTTMLKHLAFRMLPGSAGEWLPIFVELRRFVDSGEASLVQYVRALLADRYGFAVTTDDLEKRLDGGEVALLLDGLDEVLGDRHAGSAEAVYDAVGEEINRLATRFPDCPIAVTCRAHGWREGLPAFRTLEALDFDLPQVTLFVRAWYGDRPAKGEALLRALGDNQRLLGLAGNPLLLSLIAIVYDRDLELPERRAALYRRCVDVLLREWDSHRKIKRLSNFTTDRKADLLKHIAWTYHREGRRYLETDDLLAQIATFLPSVDIDPAESRAILDEIATQYGLLKEQAVGWYGFLHLTLQEYFAATALLERGQEGIDLLLRERFDPWWEEVILLFAGATPDAGPLLRGMLGLGDEPRRPDKPLTLPRDDIFHTDLFLACRCLAGVPRISDTHLRGQIVATVRAVAFTARNPAEARRAAKVLTEATGWPRTAEDLDLFLMDEAVPPANRVATVEALAETRRPEVASWFLAHVEYLAGNRSGDRDRMWAAMLDALGTMRWQPAYERLRALWQARGDESREKLLAAAVRIPEDASSLLRDLREFAEFTESAGLRLEGSQPSRVYTDAIAATAVLPAHSEPLLDLVRLDNDWFFDRIRLAQAYLAAAGAPGVSRLLEIAADPRASPLITIPVMAEVATHVRAGRDGAGVAEPLMRMIHDRALRPELLWLASECLDHLGPRPPDDLPVATKTRRPPTDPGVLGLALTRLAWGDRTQLPHLRVAVEQNLVDLIYSEPNLDRHLGRRIWQRLLPAVARYERKWLLDELTTKVNSAGELHYDGNPGLVGLFLVDVDVALGELVRWCESGRALRLRLAQPIRVSPSSISTALTALELLWPTRTRYLGTEAKNVLLQAIAAVADEDDSVRRLARLLSTAPHSPELYDALAEVSRRAKTRVVPGGEVVPLGG